MPRAQQPLTQKQYDTYRWCLDYTIKHHHPPTVRELSRHFGIFPKAMNDRLANLARRGWIKRKAKHACGMTFLGVRFQAVPVVQ